MLSHPSPQVTHDENTTLLSKTLRPAVELSPELMELREFAHKKFIPAIKRARDDDDNQDTFTSAAGNLGLAGWMLSELALRVAELADKKAN